MNPAVRTALALVVTTFAPLSAQQTPTGAWNAVVADWERNERIESPLAAAREGDREALSRWPDITPAGDARRLAALRQFEGRLRAIDAASLGEEDAFNHRFLSRVVAQRIEAAAFDGARFAFDSEGGPGGTVGYVARTTTLNSSDDVDAYLTRLAGIHDLYAAAIANARRGISTRFTQPRSVVESALEIARAEAAILPADEPLLQPFAQRPSALTASDFAAMRGRAARIIEEQVVPARREWVRFLEAEYMPAARAQLGLGSLQGGREYYAYLARSYTTTPMTPDEIHEVGAREVARIRAAMDVEMKAAAFEGTFAEFLNWLRTDPRFYAQTRDDLLMRAAEISKRADDRLPTLFRRSLPRLPYGVRPVPREIEEQYTTGRYFQGSMQLGIAGGYIVNTSRLDQRPLYELPALTLHEAVPGHHLQIAIAQELDEQPWFRRNASVTAFSEGWGLYAEFLGEEMGIYRDAFERFGRLSYEMWRACRLVADTGIHWKGWSLEQARSCFRDNSALAPHNIETELQRYIGWPGQALAYKIGELKFKELREQAAAALGDRFDVRAFHDAVLLGGPMPLEMLEARVRAWQSQQVTLDR
jgi:uncharacterized protein (DUF885 family)